MLSETEKLKLIQKQKENHTRWFRRVPEKASGALAYKRCLDCDHSQFMHNSDSGCAELIEDDDWNDKPLTIIVVVDGEGITLDFPYHQCECGKTSFDDFESLVFNNRNKKKRKAEENEEN